MGKAYQPHQREQVRQLLESGRSEEDIEKETGVSDRTIRRWKLELERTGRIGKPPESRTGRHRVLKPEIEQALCEYVKDKPDTSVDDMLWWLYDTYKIVVGTRTIRRVFERKGGDKSKKVRPVGKSSVDGNEDDQENEEEVEDDSPLQDNAAYQSPYAPMAQQAVNDTERNLTQALRQQHQSPQRQQLEDSVGPDSDLPDDEETIQLQLEQIALQKRELELKLKMRQLQSRVSHGGKQSPASVSKRGSSSASAAAVSSLYNPNAVVPSAPKRDSRSKKKIEESKKRTAERQERMLRELERRSRRRDHLTSEWVESKDIWPLRAQGMLADLMHQYSCYAFAQNQADTFEAMYAQLYQLVDLQKGDWIPHIHDEMLRERTKRKMGQLRTKMMKTGEIIGRVDGFGGFQKADDYTGEEAGAALGGDESELVPEMQGHEIQDHDLRAAAHHDLQAHEMQQTQPGAHRIQEDDIRYEPVPEHQLGPNNMQQYGMMGGPHHQGPPQQQYPMMEQKYPMMPYHMGSPMNGQIGGAQMNGNQGVMM